MQEKGAPLLQLSSVSKKYDSRGKYILQNFNLTIEKGSFVTIIGPSGSGKTTILNLIAGFIKPDKGKILLSGIDIKDIPPNQRPTATVFQDYVLFPHLNVFENIAFGLKKQKKILENPPRHKKEKMERLLLKAKFKSYSNLEKVILETAKYTDLLKKWVHKLGLREDQELSRKNKSLYQKLVIFYLGIIKTKLLDLEYWKSWWEYFPILKEQELSYKYLARAFSSAEIAEKVNKLVSLVGLTGYEQSAIDTLSGGTKQKVALARALIMEPQIVLLDEPLSAIDKDMREKMQIELKKLHQRLKLTFLLITHDQKEALLLSDKVVVLHKGKVEQFGTPSDVYDTPSNEWVANFIGKSNIFEGIYLSPQEVEVNGSIFQIENITGFSTHERVKVMIRPEDYDVVPLGQGFISVKVIDAIYKGQLWELQCNFREITLLVESFNQVKKGEEIDLLWDPIDVHLIKIERDEKWN
ncbi:spermidine/putrescine import ATP-binding protein [Mycoplasma wenyonii str. Massachusetts]|uniref:Spermidine/putrescine import ATP-binding protein n=1 Tax=Mycoplasma wenyonii (strain Massachusetts) TaxID=1197325 RepID=I6ZEH9_MYCWM|nr:ABC transporter ATP-binding protein [Mycoplasma wenyonii]AFN64997.1 spermidine/putrescine import ATP-binding protein [Mycoplasma wenyonii str. Massachusetts]